MGFPQPKNRHLEPQVIELELGGMKTLSRG